MRIFLIVPLLLLLAIGSGEVQSVFANNDSKNNVKIVLNSDKPYPISVRTLEQKDISVNAQFDNPAIFKDSQVTGVNVTPGISNTQILVNEQKAQAEAAQRIAAVKTTQPVKTIKVASAPVVQPYTGSNGDVVALGQAKCNAAFGPGEWNAFYTIVKKESGWNPNAQNRTSTAYGLGQFLNSTWKGTGVAKTSDPNLQLDAVVNYIRSRYGTPSRALQFHLSHNWY